MPKTAESRLDQSIIDQMTTGVHLIIYTQDADADRAFFRDVLKFEHVDVGGGWLIFALPPSEIALHPGAENDQHEIYLMCDDIAAFRQQMGGHGIACTEVSDQGWGLLVHITLPGGGKLGVYQPRHARP
jgi:catechol 2,3-dioxygenase-like lactoylglutathione lyase family enzyme